MGKAQSRNAAPTVVRTWKEALAIAVRAWRQSQSLSQMQLATARSVPQASVSRIERGAGICGIEIVQKLLGNDLAGVIMAADELYATRQQ